MRPGENKRDLRTTTATTREEEKRRYVYNILAQRNPVIKVYVLDKSRIRPSFVLNDHLLPRAPLWA